MSYSRGSISNIIALPTLSSNAEKIFQFTLAGAGADSSPLSLKVCFGDLFVPPVGVKWIPCIPHFRDGVLYRVWMQKNPGSKQVSAHGGYVAKFSSETENIPFTFMFNYPGRVVEWDVVFREVINSLSAECPENTILVFPTFGTNNGISYYDSAFGIFAGLRCVVESSTFIGVVLKNVKEIRVITPYSDNQANTSCRTIAHMFNMIDIFNNTDIESGKGVQCTLCMATACNIVLPCGHMLTCEMCERRLMHTGTKKCMLCKAPYSVKYRSLPVQKAPTDHKCCDRADCVDHRSKLTYIPCGHTSVLCESAESDSVTSCKICNKTIEHKLRVYN
ncbi:E3 ubiquitin-protein ligase [Yasminevirus sp. GU-2018]|uniref:E3 ubiquitin-protein ligase n=1 Tax=Yasminevirus sp. GU-2018 TaxID=2420051 RepID=A0A5K0U7W4_9VIRU|nr:E3 ubiquitin-protein ligase [Yasminevirus sp. GU-2018]